MLTVVSFKAVVRSCLFPIGESGCVTRPSNGCKRDYPYSCSSNRKKIKIIRLQLVASKNIIPCNFTAKSKLKLWYLQ